MEFIFHPVGHQLRTNRRGVFATRHPLHRLSALLSVLALLIAQNVWIVLAELPIVQAVLFYSPTCGHCHYVITEVLPPLFEQYGDQLQIMGVSIANPDGQTLYQAAIEHFSIPAERQGVPTLILGETVLVGSLEIPEQLPGLIEQYLAEGGVDWPDIPGLAKVLPTDEPTTEATSAPTPDQVTATASEVVAVSPSAPVTDVTTPQDGLLLSDEFVSEDFISKFRRDPAGNSLSVLTLLGMLVVVGYVMKRVQRVWRDGATVISFVGDLKCWRSWAVALLCVIGLSVSIYMAYVETTHTTAVCGPIGDCNTVQQSSYAVLLGVIPVGVLGILGYAAMLIAWAATYWGRYKNLPVSVLFAMALFSIYLTFLEPFVIGATCVWCLTSAVSMTLILFVLAGSVYRQPESAIQEAHA